MTRLMVGASKRTDHRSLMASRKVTLVVCLMNLKYQKSLTPTGKLRKRRRQLNMMSLMAGDSRRTELISMMASLEVTQLVYSMKDLKELRKPNQIKKPTESFTAGDSKETEHILMMALKEVTFLIYLMSQLFGA